MSTLVIRNIVLENMCINSIKRYPYFLFVLEKFAYSMDAEFLFTNVIY